MKEKNTGTDIRLWRKDSHGMETVNTSVEIGRDGEKASLERKKRKQQTRKEEEELERKSKWKGKRKDSC